mmetsp:Transcript_40058/g.129688  ORF Transcript_40058/g.129688 Transcript_40058/m.129688 type:complete len:533 (-) Transcript_40058:14-1612(-)
MLGKGGREGCESLLEGARQLALQLPEGRAARLLLRQAPLPVGPLRLADQLRDHLAAKLERVAPLVGSESVQQRLARRQLDGEEGLGRGEGVRQARACGEEFEAHAAASTLPLERLARAVCGVVRQRHELQVHVLELGAVGGAAEVALKREQRLASCGEAAADGGDVRAHLRRFGGREVERGSLVRHRHQKRVVRHQLAFGDGEVRLVADYRDQVRLELRRRRAEPTLLGDPAAPILHPLHALPLGRVLAAPLPAASSSASSERGEGVRAVSGLVGLGWGCTPKGGLGHHPKGLEPRLFLFLVLLHTRQTDHTAGVRARVEAVRRPLPEGALAATKVVARAELDGELRHLLEADLGQVLVRQQVCRQRRRVELAVKAARPRAGEQHVDADEARAARRRAQLADGRRVDAAAAAAAREVRNAQPRQLGDARAAEVEKLRRELATGTGRLERRVGLARPRREHVRRQRHSRVARQVRRERGGRGVGGAEEVADAEQEGERAVFRVDGTDAGEQAREVAARVAGDEEAGCCCHPNH